MSDAWAPPDAEGRVLLVEPPLATPTEDVHVLLLAILMMVQGVPSVVLGLLFPVVGVVGGLLDPEFSSTPGGFLIPACIGTAEGLCIGLLGALYLGAGASLLRPKPWAWIVGMVAVAFWMSSPCCMPLGAYGLFALVRERVRKVYGLS